MNRILIVTPDIEGPVRNGGIGTAFTSLAVRMARAGLDVEILYTSGSYTEIPGKTSEFWIDVYRKHGIRFTILPAPSDLRIDAPHFRRKSYAVYRWLLEHEGYDVVVACEWQADLYYALLSKRQGLAFESTRFIVNTHGSTLWADEGNYELPRDQNHMELYFMERRVAEMCDEIVSPSSYLIQWMQDRNWALPERSRVILNCEPIVLNPVRKSKNAKLPPAKQESYTELIFFGRLETRKGLDLFLRAVQRMGPAEFDKISSITFLGKRVRVGDRDSVEYISERTNRLDTKVRIIEDFDRAQAENYIRSRRALVVIPSLVENSPYTVYECLLNGFHFVAARVGGIAELIPSEHHDAILFEPKPAALVAKLAERLGNLEIGARLVTPTATVEQEWVELLAAAGQPARAIPVSLGQPRVTVCLVHYERPHLLQQAVASLSTQTYQNFDVVLVDDGSKREESLRFLDILEELFARKGWTIVRTANNYLGAARNIAASRAQGDYLLFMDDDNVAKSTEIDRFVTAAVASGCDILTNPSDVIYGDEFPAPFRKPEEIWLPLGPDLNVGSLANCFGDANALVRRSTFEALGGFSEDYGVGHEDWEFFCRAVLAGFKLELVPEPLFWYRKSKTGMLQSGDKSRDNFRSYRPFLRAQGPVQYAMALVPSMLQRIESLERQIDAARNTNPERLVTTQALSSIEERLEYLISQQRDGWAHDRFNVLFREIRRRSLVWRLWKSARRKLIGR